MKDQEKQVQGIKELRVVRELVYGGYQEKFLCGKGFQAL